MVAATSSAYNGTSVNNGQCSHICIMLPTGYIGLLLLTLCMSLLPPKGVAKAGLGCHNWFTLGSSVCGLHQPRVFHHFSEKF